MLGNTRVVRIPLFNNPHFEHDIRAECDDQLTKGFKLASSFEVNERLILIFQRISVIGAQL